MYHIYKAVYMDGEPTFVRKDEDDPEYDCGSQFINNMFDFTPLFADLCYWDSNTQMDKLSCDDALAQIRQTLLRMQSEQILPRQMSNEERAYYRFPWWWFGQYENGEPMDDMDRKQILMRHLSDMYNEIRSIPEFRSKKGPLLFYCTYSL